MENQRKRKKSNLDQITKRAKAIQQKLADHIRKNNETEPKDALYQDSQKLIEELHLYQIELEMQNEQLRLVSEELVESAAKYEDLYDFAPVGYVTLDEFGLILEANLASSALLATDRRLLLKSRFSRFVAPEHFNAFTTFLTRLISSDVKQTCELTFIRPDHTVLEVRLEGISLLGKSPEKVQCRIAIIDVSEQKDAERKARESQEFVEKIANTMPDILTVYDFENRKNLYGNREILHLIGISPEKIRAMNSQQTMELVHADDVSGFLQSMENTRHLRDGEVSEFEYRIRNSKGTYSWLRVRSVVFQRSVKGEVNQILSVQQDITFKKEAEEELRFKNQIINGLQANLPVVVSLIRPDGTIAAMTGSGINSLEKEGIENLVGQSSFQIFPDLKPQLETVFKTGEKVSFVNCLGEDQKTCFQNFVFLDTILNAAVCFSLNISNEVEAEKRIIAEREFSQNLLDNSVDGILAFDKNYRFTAWNKVMEQNTKIAKSAVLGREIFAFFPNFKNSKPGRALKKVLQGKKVVLYNQSFGINHGDYEVYLNPLFDNLNQITGGLCILHNVKIQKKLLAEKTQLKLDQQKAILNAVLASQEEERRRIAESLHNGLGQLLYAAKLNLERNPLKQNESHKLLKELLDEAIRETRTMSFELMPSILEDFGLETALQELIKRISGNKLEFTLQVNGIKRFIESIEIAVYRIIQELINNVIKHAQATKVTLKVSCEKDLLQIEISDNGIGFNEKSIALKTKGIGLTGIKNRVKLLDGNLQLETAPDQGTTVKIQLKIS